MLDASWSGRDPIGYHVTGVLLHALFSALALRLLLALRLSPGISLAAALAYAVNPFLVQAVAWIPGRGDLLLGVFGVLSFLAFERYRTERKPAALALHAAALFLAALSKETALALPAVFAVRWVLTESGRRWRRADLVVPGAWAAVAAAYLMLRANALRGLPDASLFGAGPLLANLRVLPEEIAGLLLPLRIPVMPSFTFARTALGLFLAAAIVALALARKRAGSPVFVLGVAWFVVLSVPGMMYRHEMGSLAYDYLGHRAYFPLLGLVAALADLVPASRLAAHARLAVPAWTLALAGWCVLTALHAGAFADTRAFYDQAIETNPRSALAFYNRANARRSAGDLAGARADYDEALGREPGYIMAYNNRGNVRGRLGDAAGAVEDLSRAAELRPGQARVYGNLGYWRSVAGDAAGALADYDRAISIDPRDAGTFLDRGVLRGSRGDAAGAKADFEAALAADPSNRDAMFNLGLAHLHLGDPAAACPLFRDAAQRGHPRAPEALQRSCR
jgi:tetratricopeptide (TPR) repeat protein